MKIIVAPDSFKECLPAPEVAKAMAGAARELFPDAEIVLLPLADGGEGTLDVLTSALGGKVHDVSVRDPLGRPVTAQFGALGDIGIIEVARACGLGLVAPEERNPLTATSAGVGDLVIAAHEAGCRRLVVGLGGSAICDGGRGMLSVPGVREALRSMRVELLCDVTAPLIGPDGASEVFAPQKGASPQDVEVLERRMTKWAGEMAAQTGRDVSMRPGAGAAGGLGGAFMAYALEISVKSGVDRVMDLVSFDSHLEGASLVITGEGRSDIQTLSGKVPFGVLKRSRGVPVALISGSIDERALSGKGYAALVEVTPRQMPLAQALEPSAARNLIRAAARRYLLNRLFDKA